MAEPEEAAVELTEAQPGQPVEAVEPEAPTDLPEGGELEAMVDAGELASVADGEEPAVTEGADLEDAPKLSKRAEKRAKAEKAKAEKAEAKEAEAEEVKAKAVAKETSPLEPDESSDEEASLEMPEEGDLPGIVTKLSKDMFKKLTSAWLGSGKPNRLSAFGVMWLVVDDGAKFVSQGAPGAMGDYGSLSTGYAKG